MPRWPKSSTRLADAGHRLSSACDWKPRMNEKIEFDCERMNEQLINRSSLPILDRLQWLGQLRRSTLMVREAPAMKLESRRQRNGE